MSFRRNDRHPFTRAVRRVAFTRCKDAAGVPRCEACSTAVCAGALVYDHAVPWELSRDSSLANCQVLCLTCDRAKTALDQGEVAASSRVRDRHIGALTSRHPMPCGRGSAWSRPIGGFRPVRRESQGQKHARFLRERYHFSNPEETSR